jgi:hypothetical protein
LRMPQTSAAVIVPLNESGTRRIFTLRSSQRGWAGTRHRSARGRQGFSAAQ